MQLSDGTLIYIIDDGERRFFEEHGFALPKRCHGCPRLRKSVVEDTEAASGKRYVR